MRYRITFNDSLPVEVIGVDLRVIGASRISIKTSFEENATNEVYFCTDIERIADNHNRDIYIK
jgi:hypothetical protein